MKKQCIKKLMSLAIAAALIIAVLPLSYAAGETPTTVNFDFTSANIMGKETEGKDFTKTSDAKKVVTQSVSDYFAKGSCADDENYYRNWKYFGSSIKDVSGCSMSNADGMYFYGRGTAEWNKADASSWIAFKVKGLALSDYILSLKPRTGGNNDGCVWAFYILEDNEAYYTEGAVDTAAVTDAIDTLADGVTKVGEVDTWGNSKTSMTVGNVTLSGDSSTEYIVLMRSERSGAIADGETSKVGYSQPTIRMLGLTFTPTDAETMANAAFDATEAEKSYKAPTVVGIGTDNEPISPADNGDGSFTLTANDTDKNGNAFLCWVKGMETKDNKQIISFEKKLTYYPETTGVNYLIAVYDDYAPNNAEFYNRNGQLIATGEQPESVSMAGYGSTTEWNQYGATNIYVAKYDSEDPVDVTVIVNGTPKIYGYGDEVECTSDETDFRYWTKTVNGVKEIVSAKAEYVFNAWEDCTVEAVCGGDAISLAKDMRKIILGNYTAGDESVIMAEFIGFDDAVEKGIEITTSTYGSAWSYATQRIAMTSNKTQFAIANDSGSAKSVTGYAIVKDGESGYIKVTDGELTVAP